MRKDSEYCPVCKGWGWIADDNLTNCPKCKACEGTGSLYIWHKKRKAIAERDSFLYWRNWIKAYD